MNIVLKDGTLISDVSPVNMCTGYKAKSLVMKARDFEELRRLSHTAPVQFEAVMIQLEGRFG